MMKLVLFFIFVAGIYSFALAQDDNSTSTETTPTTNQTTPTSNTTSTTMRNLFPMMPWMGRGLVGTAMRTVLKTGEDVVNTVEKIYWANNQRPAPAFKQHQWLNKQCKPPLTGP